MVSIENIKPVKKEGRKVSFHKLHRKNNVLKKLKKIREVKHFMGDDDE